MEVFDMAMWMASAASLTPPVMVSLQWLKEHAWWRNQWCITIAPFVGLILVIAAMVASGMIYWDGNALIIVNPVEFYKSTLQGIFGGMAAPLGYNLQKGLPEQVRPFKAGPDNHRLDTTKIEEVQNDNS